MSLFAEFFTLPKGISSFSAIDFNAKPTAKGTATQLNMENTNTAFWSGGATDNFAARYQGDVNIKKAGTYTFYLKADGQARLYIDGKQVTAVNGDTSVKEGLVKLNLTAGAHDIEIRYFDKTGTQTLDLDWKGPDSGNKRASLAGDSLTYDPALNTPAPVTPTPTVPTTPTTPAPTVPTTPTAPATAGLKAEYFVLAAGVSSLDQINFNATPTATGKVASLNLSGNASFWQGGATDNFAARYTGELNVTKAGTYTIYLTSDDGSQLWIDGQRVINNDGLHAATEQSVTLSLSAGKHTIGLRYFERTGEQTLDLDWSGPDSNNTRVNISGTSLTNGTATTPVTPTPAPTPTPTPPVVTPEPTTPTAPTTPGIAGLKAEYFILPAWTVSSLSQIDFNGTPAATGTVTSLNIFDGSAPFWTGGPADHFAARYTGDLNVVNAGQYTIYLSSDDGSALYVDGRMVIGNDGLHSTQERSVTLNLTAGAHDIEIRYFEQSGGQTLALAWQGPDSSNVRRPIGGTNLSSEGPINAGTPGPCPATGGAVCTCADDTTDADDDGHHDHGIADGLQAEFFALAPGVTSLAGVNWNGTPTATGMSHMFNATNTNSAFWTGGPTDNFAARYTGDLNVKAAGQYTIYLSSDDGSQLFIDGRQVIANDGLHGTQERSVTLNLTAGAHDIEIRYFEATGQQTLDLDWSGPDSGNQRVGITGDSLTHGTAGGTPVPEDDHDHGAPTTPTTPTTPTSPTTPTTPTTPDHSHGDDAAPTIALPTSASQVNAYVAAVKAQAEASHADHDATAAMVKEHDALLKLVVRSEATHVAIKDGDWSDPGTWHQGRVPGEGAKVLIPEGVDITYDAVSNASLFTVRVDGSLSFQHDINTKMVVDTLVVSPTGRLEIGTEDHPIAANVDAVIEIANNGNINVAWDPMLLSRGIVSQGEVEIHGAEKTAFVAVDDAPMAGARVLDLAEVPQGWQVGDTIVITGTHKEGWYWDNAARAVTYHETQDEEVVITAINGTSVTIDRALRYNHDAPRDDLSAYVSNMTRNITVSSEDGEATPVHQRGHVMFMHSDEVDVRYAAFDDLGRTDKSEDAFDIGTLSRVTSDSNIKGRYSVHFHKTGTSDVENPAIALGNTVSGGAGWGFVQHSSNANFIDNVAFDVFGAAFAAEDGDEIGLWDGNMAIRSQGIGPGDYTVKDGDDVARHDNGRTGDGFFFAGRLVEASNNVAANTTNGYVWFHRSAPADPLASVMDQPEIAYGQDRMEADKAVIQGFHDNEAFGTHSGLIVIKANTEQNHDVRSVFDGFLNWETKEGVNLSYTAHYTLKDFDLIGTTAGGFNDTASGISIGSNAFDMTFNGLKIEGFQTGADLSQDFTFSVGNASVGHVFIDVAMIDVGRGYVDFNSARHTILTSNQLTEDRLTFNLSSSTTLSENQSFSLSGLKTDSIGSHSRQFDGDAQVLQWNQHIAPLIANEGYWRTSDGRNVILIEDFVADRATGELLKFAHVVTLNMTQDAINRNWGVNENGGAKYNGVITLDGRPPVAADDFAFTREGQDVLINVLANDRDPQNDRLAVDGLTNPEHGWVFEQDDGSLLYRPHDGFEGTDTFDYWATDDAGLYAKATVTVTVEVRV